MRKILPIILLMVIASGAMAKQKMYGISSPDQKIQVEITVDDFIYYSAKFNGQVIIKDSPIFLKLANGKILGKDAKIDAPLQTNYNELVETVAYKKMHFYDKFNELSLISKEGYSVSFRVHNDGFAYRWETNMKDEITIEDEGVNINLAGIYESIYQPTSTFVFSYENNYKRGLVSTWEENEMAALPALFSLPGGAKMVFTEADLLDYPGLYLKKNGQNGEVAGVQAKYPKTEEPMGGTGFTLDVKDRENYIAKTKGTRSYPWRVFAIVEHEKELLNSDHVYRLSSKPEAGNDFSWVKPGKVAWDWWSDMNLTGVKFKAGVNTQTYKYFIDFAAANGIEYVNLDEGWSDQYDLLKLDPQIDLKDILSYAKHKNVGIILWCVSRTLDRQMIEAMDNFQKLGVAGIKVDFMDRDDQKMVNFYERTAREAAKRKLLVNFHGAYKPTGMNRKWPNVVNHEGVRGLEYNKFNDEGTSPDYATIIPYTRMVAGYMDYTPGAMHNMNKGNWAKSFGDPASQGTRCQQLALYVMLEAPLLMMSDRPTEYEKDKTILKYLADVPTTWDETVALDGRIGEYAIIARRKHDVWYISGITNWEARKVNVNLDFLYASYDAELFEDGINADRIGNDYTYTTKVIKGESVIPIQMQPGGGFVMVLKQK